jgi:hypothetical protein
MVENERSKGSHFQVRNEACRDSDERKYEPINSENGFKD